MSGIVIRRIVESELLEPRDIASCGLVCKTWSRMIVTGYNNAINILAGESDEIDTIMCIWQNLYRQTLHPRVVGQLPHFVIIMNPKQVAFMYEYLPGPSIVKIINNYPGIFLARSHDADKKIMSVYDFRTAMCGGSYKIVDPTDTGAPLIPDDYKIGAVQTCIMTICFVFIVAGIIVFWSS